MRKNFAIFVSGYGRGAIDLIKKSHQGLIEPNLQLIVSSNPASEALKVAKEHDIKTFVHEKQKDQSIAEYEQELIQELKNNAVEYIFLAGWMRILSKSFIENFTQKIINIHPSLLPSFKGLNAIDQALDYGVKITGITTHFVDATIDGGTIIGQKAVYIEANDDFKTLDAKIFDAGKELSFESINQVFV